MRATGAREQATAKFIQICASQNDLFALDEHGNIYRYNFSTKAWATLDADVDVSAPTRRMAAKEPNDHRGEIVIPPCSRAAGCPPS